MAEAWTISKIIEWTTKHFQSKKIESARLDAELLLAKVLGCRRLDLYLRFDQPLKEPELAAFREFVKRRSQYEPVAYITGVQEFYGRPFKVGAGVLIPRPETELLVDEALRWLKESGRTEAEILDVGCGSGAIAVTMACEVVDAHVAAIDRSAAACGFTSANSQEQGVMDRMKIVESDFMAADNHLLGKKFDLVLSNPPYIAESAELMPDVKNHEPAEALFGGAQGFELIENWLPQLAASLKPGGLLLVEIGYDQGEKILQLANKTEGLQGASVIKDFSGHPRIFRATKQL